MGAGNNLSRLRRSIKIGKLLREKLDVEFDISRKWSQNYSILKKD